MRRALVLLALLGAAVVLPVRPASAHPLGNFTVNQFSGIVVRPGAVEVEVVVDMAEIPAFQTRGDIDTDGDGRVAPEERATYHERACGDLTAGLALHVDGRPRRLGLRSGDVSFPPGQAGLPTLRLRCHLATHTGEGAGAPADVTFSNTNFADRVGWREIIATGDGVHLVASDVPVGSLSHRLTRYPDDLLQSPLDQRRASLRVGPGAPGAAAPVPDPAGGGSVPPITAPRAVDRLTAAFTGLVARQDLTFGFGILALAVALALGALHALAPGHGKTVMAAYLVGQRGSLRQAVGLGLTVTATHTAGVLVLGVLLSGSTSFVPERIYVWLRLASGTMLAVVGASLLRRALGRRRDEHHHHHHDGDTAMEHAHPHPVRTDDPGVSRRALVAMGAAGGMVPSPSALVVLLGAIALGRTWFGVGLVLAYGAGMAVSLLAAGLLLTRFRGAVDTRLQRSRATWMGAAARAVPVVAAALVVVVGLGIAAGAVIRA